MRVYEAGEEACAVQIGGGGVRVGGECGGVGSADEGDPAILDDEGGWFGGSYGGRICGGEDAGVGEDERSCHGVFVVDDGRMSY